MTDENVKILMSSNPSMSRRTFIKTAAGIVAVAAASGIAYYYLGPPSKPKVAPEVGFESWGGTFQAGLRKACFDPFEEEFGITVIEGSFGGADEVRSKIKAAGGGEWDVLETDNESGYYGSVDDVWEPLDMDQIPNANYLPEIFRDPVGSPRLEEGIHYYLLAPIYGTTGMAYNYENVVPAPTSISHYWDENYAGKISLSSDWSTRILHAALYLGEKDINNITDIDAIWESLREQKKVVVKYWESGTEFETLLETGEAWIAESWGGRILNMELEGRAPLKYIIPKEGASTWSEALMIGKNPPNKENAHSLINYMLDPEVQQKIAEETKYPPCIEPQYIDSLEKIKDLPDYVGSDFHKLKFLDMDYWITKRDEWSAMWETIMAE